MRKCSNVYKIIEECHKVIEKDKYLITDKYNNNQNSYFKDNRHDQSILSLVRKILGTIIINGTNIDDKYSKNNLEPFWATRMVV